MSNTRIKTDEYLIRLDRVTARRLSDRAERAGYVDDSDFLTQLLTDAIHEALPYLTHNSDGIYCASDCVNFACSRHPTWLPDGQQAESQDFSPNCPDYTKEVAA